VKNLVHKVLETPFWPEDLQTMKQYFRTHDDCDGELSNGIVVTISTDGDAWVETCPGGCRFRMPMTGGGLSPRVRNALLLLAVAIQLDNQEHAIPAALPSRLPVEKRRITVETPCTTPGCTCVFKPVPVLYGRTAFSQCPECGAFVDTPLQGQKNTPPGPPAEERKR